MTRSTRYTVGAGASLDRSRGRRDGRFGSKVGQIGPKSVKSGAFSDQISLHPKKPRICPIWRQSDPLWNQTYHPWMSVKSWYDIINVTVNIAFSGNSNKYINNNIVLIITSQYYNTTIPTAGLGNCVCVNSEHKLPVLIYHTGWSQIS